MKWFTKTDISTGHVVFERNMLPRQEKAKGLINFDHLRTSGSYFNLSAVN